MNTTSSSTTSRLIRAAYADTPGACKRVHFDNCGSALMAAPVIEALKEYQQLEFDVGGYVAQERVVEKLESIYSQLARLFGGGENDYALTPSSVEAWVRAFYSIPLEKGDVILTGHTEYCANFFAFLHRKERDGVEIRVAKPSESGRFDIEQFASLIDEKVKLIAVTHIPCSSGQELPVKQIGDLAREAGCYYLLDACQAAGHVPLNVGEIGCHMLAATSRKFMRGPRGTGFLYINAEMRSAMSPAFLTNNSAVWISEYEMKLREDARLFEVWERSVLAQIGFKAALDYYEKMGPQLIFDIIKERAATLRARLAALPGVRLTCPPGSEAGIVGFQLGGHSVKEVKTSLERQDIAIQFASLDHARLDLETRDIDIVARLSPHVYTRDADIDTLAAALEGIAKS